VPQQLGSSQYEVIGTYLEMRGAREAIQALEFAGVEVRDIELLGKVADDAAEKADQEQVTVTRDAGIVWRVARHAILFGIAGGIAGTVIGFILAGVGAEFAQIGDSPAIGAASWGLFGVIVGALVGLYTAFAIGAAWELTFEPVEDGEVLVGVHSDDAREVEKAARVLRAKGAVRVARVGANSHPHPA
jgi:hypothetical protein